MAGETHTHATLSIDGTTSTDWSVMRVETHESVFDGYRVHVHAASVAPAQPDDWIGRDATAIVRTAAGERSFHGVVLEIAEDAGDENHAYAIDVVVGARIELLKLGRDHRIYQEKSVPDVVKDVLSRAGLTSKCEWSLNGSYEPLEYIAQYGESDFDFITRLLLEEGIGFYIRDAEDAETYVFFDDGASFEPIDGDGVLHDRSVATTSLETLTLAFDRSRVASDQVMQRDYDLKRPGADLSTHAEAEQTTAREVYLHPGNYVASARGQRLTDRLLQRLRMRCRTLGWESDCIRIAPGRTFTLVDATREGVNGEYLAVDVFHRCEAVPASDGTVSWDPALSYSCVVEAIPVDVPYRPQVAAAPPCIHGVQPAFVTVPGGEEIHSDEHGRAKARLPWDRSGITDDKSSSWMRVGQLALGGSMVLPRQDFEVLVDFEMGSHDRPAISGHLYNAEKGAPYALPAGKTRSSFQTATTSGGPGANELRFEDAAGAEEIYLNASKDLTASVDNETLWHVTANETLKIGSNNTLSVKAAHKTTVTGKRTLEVSGNQSVDVAGELGDGTAADSSVTIGAARNVKAGGDHSESVGGTLQRTVGSMQLITGLAGVQRTIVGDSTTHVSAAWGEVAGAARGLSVTGSYTETIGAAKLIKAKVVTVTCGVAYTMNAAAELVKAGGGRTDSANGVLALSAGGAFKVKAKNIVFEAKTKLVFRGGTATIELTSSGDVKIKAGKVTVTNSEALVQLDHKSN